MRMLRNILGVLAALITGFVAASATAQPVSIGALPQGSLSYSIASAVAKVIADKTDLKTRAIGIGGGNIYHPQVHRENSICPRPPYLTPSLR